MCSVLEEVYKRDLKIQKELNIKDIEVFEKYKYTPV